MKRISASEANAGRFYQSPKAFVTDDFYKTMSVHAKYLYGILRDRFDLSLMNGWVDDNDAIYIYFTVDEIKEVLGVGKNKAIQIKKELQDYDLLEEVSQGLNKPNRLYVGQVVFHRGEASNDAEVYKSNFREFKNQTSGGLKNKLQEVYKSNPNETEFNKTDHNDTELIFNFEDDDETTSARVRREDSDIQNEANNLIESEPWIMNTEFSRYWLDWSTDNLIGAVQVLKTVVDQYWRLRRAEDLGQLSLRAMDSELGINHVFVNAKRIADDKVVDSRQYFDYLGRGIEMQTDKLLYSTARI